MQAEGAEYNKAKARNITTFLEEESLMWPLNKCSYFNQASRLFWFNKHPKLLSDMECTKFWNLIWYWLHWWLKHLLGAITSLLFYHIKVSHLLHPIWKKFQDLVNWTETYGIRKAFMIWERYLWSFKFFKWNMMHGREKDVQDKGYMDFQESRKERGATICIKCNLLVLSHG